MSASIEQQRVALVTGASGGLGHEFARVLAAAGVMVVLSGRRGCALRRLAKEIGGKVIQADLREHNAGELLRMIETQLTGKPVSILVNNAGIGHSDLAVDCPEMVWRDVMEVDLTIPFLLAQEAARRMIKHGIGGCIVNISSIFGERPAKAMIAYAAAKAGLMQMTRCLALELGSHGIRVNALTPGWHRTAMTAAYLATDRGRSIERDIPLHRFGVPADLGAALMLLVTSDYINGISLTVDGGLSAAMRDGGLFRSERDKIADNYLEAAEAGFPTGVWGFEDIET